MPTVTMQRQIRFLTAWLNTRSTKLDGSQKKTLAQVERATGGHSVESAVAPLLAKGFIRKVESSKDQRYSITKKGVNALNRHSAAVHRMLDGTL